MSTHRHCLSILLLTAAAIGWFLTDGADPLPTASCAGPANHAASRVEPHLVAVADRREATPVGATVGHRYAVDFRMSTTVRHGQGAPITTGWRGAGALDWHWLPAAHGERLARLQLALTEHHFDFAGRPAPAALAELAPMWTEPFVVEFDAAGEVQRLRFAPTLSAAARNALRTLVLDLGLRFVDGAWSGTAPAVGGMVGKTVTTSRAADGGLVVAWQKTAWFDPQGRPLPAASAHSFGTTTLTAALDLQDVHYHEAWSDRALAPEVTADGEFELHLVDRGELAAPAEPALSGLVAHAACGGLELDEQGQQALHEQQVAAARATPTAAHLAVVGQLLRQRQRGSPAMVRAFLALAHRLALVADTLPEVLAQLETLPGDSSEADVLLGALGAAGTQAATDAVRERLLDGHRHPAFRAAAARALHQRANGDDLEPMLLTVLAEPDLDRDVHTATLLLLGTAARTATPAAGERLWHLLLANRERALERGLLGVWEAAVRNAGREVPA